MADARVAEPEYYEQPSVWRRQEASAEEARRADLIAAWVPRDAHTVLDIGCGNGFVTNRIRAPRVVGVDPHPGLVRSVSGHPVVGAAEALPIRGTVDAIVLSEVLEHLPDGTLRQVVQEVARLAPATVVVSVPEEEDIGFSVCECARGHVFHATRHVQSLRERDVAELFPAYRTVRAARTTATVRYSRWVRRLARALRIRFTWAGARCPVCGGPSVPSPRALTYFFRAFSGSDRIVQALRGRRSTYHIVMRLDRAGEAI